MHLTVTEFLILKSLAERPGHVKNRDQLMDAAYGETIYVDDRTIDSHIKRRAPQVPRGRRRVRADRNALWHRISIPRRLSRVSAVVARLRAAFEHLAAHGTGRRPQPPCRAGLGRGAWPADAAAPPPAATRRYSPLTRRILLLNIVPVALLALGAVYLSDYEDELIDAELASLLVQGEMVAAGIGEVAVVGGETTVNRLDAEAGAPAADPAGPADRRAGPAVQRDRRAAGRFGRC